MIERMFMHYADDVKQSPVKINSADPVDTIMSMDRYEMEKLFMSVVRKHAYALASRNGKQKYIADRSIRDVEKHLNNLFKNERDLMDTLVYFVEEGAIVPTKKSMTSNKSNGDGITMSKKFTIKASRSAIRRRAIKASDESGFAYKSLLQLCNYIRAKFHKSSMYDGVDIDVTFPKRTANDGWYFEVRLYCDPYYDNDNVIKIVSTDDSYLNDTFLYSVGYDVRKHDYTEISRFGAGDKFVNIIDDIARNMSSDTVESSESMYCSTELGVQASDGRRNMSVVLDRDTAYDLKDYLRRQGIKFDTSGYGDDTYFSLYVSDTERDMIDDYIDRLGDHDTMDVEEFFEQVSDVNSAESVGCARDIECGRDTTVDKEAVRELVLYITNKSDLYPQVQSIVKNMQRKIKQGKYDDELAVKAWQYLADAGVEKYDKEFGSGNGTKSMLNKATREQIARELRDYYADAVNEGVEASKSVACSQDISGSNLITL